MGDTMTNDYLAALSYKELQGIAKAYDISANQKKEALIKDILDQVEGPSDSTPETAVEAPEPAAETAASDVEDMEQDAGNDSVMLVEPSPADEPAAEASSSAAVQPAVAESATPAAAAAAAMEAKSAASLKSLEAAKRKLEEDKAREANSAARREAMANRSKEMNARLKHEKDEMAARAPPSWGRPAPAVSKPASKLTHAAALPRVAMLSSAAPPPKPAIAKSTDRFGGVYSVYHQSTETPNPNAYADAVMQPSTRGAPTGLSFDSGYSDRFAGHDSRYKKGLRQSTMPVHDPAVYGAKQVDESVPLPKVAHMAPQPEKREILPSNERFAGPASIYHAPITPAVNAYDTSVDACASKLHVVPLDKQSERFVGPDSYLNAPEGPAVTAYDTSVDACASKQHIVPFDKQSERFVGPDSYLNAPEGPAVTAYDAAAAHDRSHVSTTSTTHTFESGYADRFAGPDSRYRKGLRQSTVPEARDPSSFPKLQGISKANAANANKGSALRAALKATIAQASKLAPVSESHSTEVKENTNTIA